MYSHSGDLVIKFPASTHLNGSLGREHWLEVAKIDDAMVVQGPVDDLLLLLWNEYIDVADRGELNHRL